MRPIYAPQTSQEADRIREIARRISFKTGAETDVYFSREYAGKLRPTMVVFGISIDQLRPILRRKELFIIDLNSSERITRKTVTTEYDAVFVLKDSEETK